MGFRDIAIYWLLPAWSLIQIFESAYKVLFRHEFSLEIVFEFWIFWAYLVLLRWLYKISDYDWRQQASWAINAMIWYFIFSSFSVFSFFSTLDPLQKLYNLTNGVFIFVLTCPIFHEVMNARSHVEDFNRRPDLIPRLHSSYFFER